MTDHSTTFVALSGGVDSSVVAYLLKEQGHSLVGVSHIVWPESKCCETVCLDYCLAFSNTLQIPYYKIDCIVPFCRKVIDPFVDTYHHGKTPNPCVLCNEYIRFDQMLSTLFDSHPELKSDSYKIATGHYAQVENRDGHYYLKRGLDPSKDQSYMLYRLSQEQLSHCLFPIGGMLKSEVRKLAEQWNLASAQKKDSQDACFVKDTYPAFLEAYSSKIFPKGPMLDTYGNIIGEHHGIPYYTRGQRKGLQLSTGPWYVNCIDVEKNAIVLGRKTDLVSTKFEIDNCNWIHLKDSHFLSTVQTRYHSMEKQCSVELVGAKKAIVTLASGFYDVTPGQSAVLYDQEYVIGGGIISEILE